jgi:hypothetical protein
VKENNRFREGFEIVRIEVRIAWPTPELEVMNGIKASGSARHKIHDSRLQVGVLAEAEYRGTSYSQRSDHYPSNCFAHTHIETKDKVTDSVHSNPTSEQFTQCWMIRM